MYPTVTAITYADSMSPSVFNQSIPVDDFSDDAICIYYQNVRGLRTKSSDFYIACSECDYDIIAITETGLIPSIHDSEIFNSDEYLVYRCDRGPLNSFCENGGGVLIAVRSGIASEVVVVADTDMVEMIVVRCVYGKRTLYICCLYIPSGSCADVYLLYASAIERVLDHIGIESDDTVFFLGDFNIPSFEWSPDPDNINVMITSNVGSGCKADVLHAVMAGGLSQMNHVSNYRGTILDLVFCNTVDGFEILKCSVPLTPVDPHHEPIEIYLDMALPPMVKPSTVKSFNFSKADFVGLNTRLASLDWNDIFNNSVCIDSAVDTFYDVLAASFQIFVPIKTSKRTSHPAWYCKRIIQLKNLKNKYHRKFKISRSIPDYNLYSVTRKQLVDAQHKAYKSFTRTTELQLRKDPSKFWSYVNTKKKNIWFSVYYASRTYKIF